VKLVSRLIPAKGYTIYAGADISAILTNEKIVWACSANLPKTLYNGALVNVIFIQPLNGAETTALIPLNEGNTPLLNARGSLNGLGIPVYVGWDKTVDRSPVAYAYSLEDELPHVEGAVLPTDISLPHERWIQSPTGTWIVTDELIREKFRLTDTLLNAVRKVLIQSGLAKD